MVLKYIHTIKGFVAGFVDGQICYASRPRKNGWHPKLLNSLKQIKDEQRKSKEYRRKLGFTETDYGYQIVEL